MGRVLAMATTNWWVVGAACALVPPFWKYGAGSVVPALQRAFADAVESILDVEKLSKAEAEWTDDYTRFLLVLVPGLVHLAVPFRYEFGPTAFAASVSAGSVLVSIAVIEYWRHVPRFLASMAPIAAFGALKHYCAV